MQLLVLPIAFLRLGQVETADYVSRQLDFAFEGVDPEASCLTRSDGTTVQQGDKIFAERYVFVQGESRVLINEDRLD